MKKFYAITIIFLFLVMTFIANEAFAVSPKNAREAAERAGSSESKVGTASTATSVKKSGKLQERSSLFIDNRIEFLQKLIERIDGDKRLSDDEKNTIKAQVNNEIKKLQDLKTKILQDTDDQTIREDFKNVLADKIYLHFVPNIRMTVIIGNLLSSEKKMEDLSQRIQTLINNLKSEGQDVTSAQKALDDMNTRLANIKNMLNSDKEKLKAATSTNYKDTYVTVRQDLAKVRSEFAFVRADIAKLRKELKGLKKTVTTTPTVKPSGSL